MNQTSLITLAKNATLAIVFASLIAGCGGGSGSAANGSLYGMPPGSVGSPQPVPTPPPNSTLATFTLKGAPGFINGAGRTVYVFDADLANPGHSVCNADCAANWPPVGVAGLTIVAPFSTITRNDGTRQLAYSGRPLYTFIADGAEGQANGDLLNAFGGVWHIARPH